MDPLQWMGAVRMRVWTADKKHLNNPHDSSPWINVLWNENLHVSKQIQQEVFNFKPLLLAKIPVPLTIILLSPLLPRLNQETNMHR